MKMKKFSKRHFFKVIGIVYAFVFLLSQNGGDTCLLFIYQPLTPKLKDKIKIKDTLVD